MTDLIHFLNLCNETKKASITNQSLNYWVELLSLFCANGTFNS